MFILASFLSWFKTNYSVHPCIFPFLVQKKTLLKDKITHLQNKKQLFITDIKKEWRLIGAIQSLLSKI